MPETTYPRNVKHVYLGRRFREGKIFYRYCPIRQIESGADTLDEAETFILEKPIKGVFGIGNVFMLTEPSEGKITMVAKSQEGYWKFADDRTRWRAEDEVAQSFLDAKKETKLEEGWKEALAPIKAIMRGTINPAARARLLAAVIEEITR